MPGKSVYPLPGPPPDVVTDVFPDVVTAAFTGAFADVFTGAFTDVFTGVFTGVFIVVFADVVPQNISKSLNNISKTLKHHLRNQGGHFLKSAFNRVLIPAQECRGKMLQNRTRIMDLQNKNNILVAK